MAALLLASSLIAAATAASTPLKVATYRKSPNGFTSPIRGWSPFPLEANPDSSPDFKFDQSHIQTQCDILSTTLAPGNYTYCLVDSGWSVGAEGDEHGRIIPEASTFEDIPGLASELHAKGLKLGLYVVPGAFIADADKTILDTDTKIGEICSGNTGLSRCEFDYSHPATQKWHDSVVNLFAEWGVDAIKLDFVTPGSPSEDSGLPSDQSGSVIAFHNAITQSKREIHLEISWKLDRSKEFFEIWNQNADSMRTDQDINNMNGDTLVNWDTVQRAIENYRQWIVAGLALFDTLAVRPGLDILPIGDYDSITDGATKEIRQTMLTHWIGAGADLVIGSDLTTLDKTGIEVLTNEDVLAIAEFTSVYPIQPRNPGTGGQDPKQVQAWIAGPSPAGEAVVIVANYGPAGDQAGYETHLEGVRTVTVSLEDLGLEGAFNVHNVWTGKKVEVGKNGLSFELGEKESVLLKLERVGFAV
ncbi:glycoside hydrolase superfamily [Aspergillus crustosus]